MVQSNHKKKIGRQVIKQYRQLYLKSTEIGLQKILNISNTKTGSQYSIEVDRSSIMYLIREEESSKKFLSDFEASRQTADTGNEETTIEEGADKETKQSDPKEEMNENVQEDTKLDVIVAPKQNSSIPIITARALYVNPPKKTRRHRTQSTASRTGQTLPGTGRSPVPDIFPAPRRR